MRDSRVVGLRLSSSAAPFRPWIRPLVFLSMDRMYSLSDSCCDCLMSYKVFGNTWGWSGAIEMGEPANSSSTISTRKVLTPFDRARGARACTPFVWFCMRTLPENGSLRRHRFDSSIHRIICFVRPKGAFPARGSGSSSALLRIGRDFTPALRLLPGWEAIKPSARSVRGTPVPSGAL